MPPGSGGYINYDHSADTIVGIPLDGKITKNGFWLKWKALKTPFMRKVVEQMKAMKDAGWPRRYGMSIEGVVKQYDPHDPTRILKAFIRNVALTPTPVHPGTFVDFAKSLAAGATLEYRPHDARRTAIAAWSQTVASIATGNLIAKSNRYFRPNGTFYTDQDVAYFTDVHGLPEAQATWCARFALSRERKVVKALGDFTKLQSRSRGHPHDIIRDHLNKWKQEHPECPHVDADGRFEGGLREAARHFYGCERRNGAEVNAILELLRDSSLVQKEV